MGRVPGTARSGVETVRGSASGGGFGSERFISRFGVMFFDDPVQAFTNIRRAATEDAMARLIRPSEPRENPFMTTAERAAAPLLPNLRGPVRMRRVSSPSPTSAAYAAFCRKAAGPVSTFNRSMSLAVSTRELIGYFTRLGPVGRSSIPSGAPLIPMCTVQTSGLPLPAGLPSVVPAAAAYGYTRRLDGC